MSNFIEVSAEAHKKAKHEPTAFLPKSFIAKGIKLVEFEDTQNDEFKWYTHGEDGQEYIVGIKMLNFLANKSGLIKPQTTGDNKGLLGYDLDDLLLDTKNGKYSVSK